MIRNFLKKLEERLTAKSFLKNMNMTKKAMVKLLSESQWKKNVKNLAEKEKFSASDLLEALRPSMEALCKAPGEGWLVYICEDILA